MQLGYLYKGLKTPQYASNMNVRDIHKEIKTLPGIHLIYNKIGSQDFIQRGMHFFVLLQKLSDGSG